MKKKKLDIQALQRAQRGERASHIVRLADTTLRRLIKHMKYGETLDGLVNKILDEAEKPRTQLQPRKAR